MDTIYNSFDEFVDYYLSRGFGSMNKNDFEVLLFNQLRYTELCGKSNYEISVFLKIPETKVKRLRYEADLKYGNYGNQTKEEYYKERFDIIAKNAKVKNKGKNILFAIEDVAFRKYIESLLKKGNLFSDSSFNSEIINLYVEDYLYLLREFYGESEVEKLKKDIKKKAQDEETPVKDLLSKFLDIAVENLAGHAIDLTLSGIKLLLS